MAAPAGQCVLSRLQGLKPIVAQQGPGTAWVSGYRGDASSAPNLTQPASNHSKLAGPQLRHMALHARGLAARPNSNRWPVGPAPHAVLWFLTSAAPPAIPQAWSARGSQAPDDLRAGCWTSWPLASRSAATGAGARRPVAAGSTAPVAGTGGSGRVVLRARHGCGTCKSLWLGVARDTCL